MDRTELDSAVLQEVAELLYGDGLIMKMNPVGSDLSSPGAHATAGTPKKTKKEKRTEEERDALARKIGYTTNAAGAVAGPAALWQANKARKSGKGGVPRDIARGIAKPRGTHRKVGPVRQKTARAVASLDNPKSKPAKIFAAGAGASIVGLQAANWGGDIIAAHTLGKDNKKNQQKKERQEALSKRLGNGVLISKDIKEIPESIPSRSELTAAIAMKGSDKVVAAKKKGCFKKLPNKVKTTRSKDRDKVEKSVEYDVRWDGEISKLNVDKQQVFGWASIVEMNGEPVVDLQGDYIAIDEVEKSAYEYVHKSRKGGDMHLRDGDQPVHKSDMIESFVVTPEKKEALGLPESTPIGWWVGYQINDPELWDNVKNGKRTGFSIHGRGMRSPA